MGKDKKNEEAKPINRIKQIQKTKKEKKKTVVNLSESFSRFFSRFGLIVLTVITLCGLIYIVIALNEIMQQPYASDANSGATSSNTASSADLITIDQTTIDKFNSLKPSSANITQTPPSGRVNPFTE